MPRLHMPKMNEVNFELYAEWEQDDPKGHFCNEEDVEFVREQIRHGNVWGWCSVEVKAKFTTEDGEEVEASDYLGGCSYRSRRDFMEPGGYYDDMKNVSYAELCEKLKALGYR